MQRCISAWHKKLGEMHLFCTKYELIYSKTKSKDIFFPLFFGSAIFYFCGIHSRTRQTLCGGSSDRWKLFWAVHQPYDCQLRGRVSSAPSTFARAGEEKKLSRFTRSTQTPVYPCSTCSLISLKDLIYY